MPKPTRYLVSFQFPNSKGELKISSAIAFLLVPITDERGIENVKYDVWGNAKEDFNTTNGLGAEAIQVLSFSRFEEKE
jgi:hypothetical protein